MNSPTRQNSSRRAARMLAAIESTRFLPSSTERTLAYSL